MSAATVPTKHDVAVYVTCTPGVLGGKPCIAGTRIRVQDIYSMHEQRAMSVQDILVAWPHLTHAQVHGALAWAWENRPQILALLERERQFVEQLERLGPSLTEKALARVRGDKPDIPPGLSPEALALIDGLTETAPG